MKRPIIIWLICTILLTLCVAISGCKTGGTTLSTGNLQKGSDGIWRLKKAPSVAPIEPKTVVEEPQNLTIVTNKVESVKVPLKPAKSRPTIEPKSAEATNENSPPVEGVGELTPFEPSVSETLFEPSVSETPITQPTEKSPTDQKLSTEPLKSDVKVSVNNEIPKEKNYIKVHWAVLLLGLIMFVWIVYDIIRDFVKDRRVIAALKSKPVKKRTSRKKKSP